MPIFLDSMLWNPQVLYLVHKTPLFAPVLSQMNSLHTILLYLRYTLISSHPCRVFTSMPGLHSLVLLLDFPTRPCVHFSSLRYTPRECRTDLLLKWVVGVQGFLVRRKVGCIVGHVLTSWATVSFTSGTLFHGISEVSLHLSCNSWFVDTIGHYSLSWRPEM